MSVLQEFTFVCVAPIHICSYVYIFMYICMNVYVCIIYIEVGMYVMYVCMYNTYLG